MRFERTDSFAADYRRLSEAEREQFRGAVRQINQVFATTLARHEGRLEWPAALRIKAIRGATGILEMTWSFSGPDGRATFELIDIEGEPGIRWRRIGGHRIFREP
jgi:hypothetical protein